MMAILILIGWLVITGLLSLRDFFRTQRLMESLDVFDLRHAAQSEPSKRRALLETLADRLEERPENLDDVLLVAYRSMSEISFGPPSLVALVRDLIVGSAVAVPFARTAFEALSSLASAQEKLTSLDARGALIQSTDIFAEPTQLLSAGYRELGIAAALLTVGVAVHHLLQAARVREARFAAATTRAAVRIAGDVPAAAVIRVFPHFASPTDLARPTLATFAGVLAVTAAWGALVTAAPIRNQRNQPLHVDLWPKGEARPVELPPGLDLARTSGGAPVGAVTGTFFVTPTEIKVGSVLLGPIEEGRLPPEWERTAVARIELAEGLPDLGRSVVLAADAGSRAVDIRALIVFAERRVRGAELSLLVARELGDDDRQASLRTRTILAQASTEPPLVFLGTGRVSYDEEELRRPRAFLRDRILEAARRGQSLEVPIDIRSDDVTFAEVISIVGSADVSCASGAPCWLPGMGIELRWVRPPRRTGPR